MYVIKTNSMRVPLKVWSAEGSIEPQCIEQMKNVCALPFVPRHISLMPDGHLGIGASIGSVVPLKDNVVCSIVGVDIGCGVCALRTNVKDFDIEILKKVISQIRQVIPVGFNKQKVAQDQSLMPTCKVGEVCDREYGNALLSIGSLGSGNHFCELQKDPEGNLWVMLHSGSRNLGKQVADFYIKKAETMNAKYFSSVPAEHKLAFLPLDSQEGQDYLTEMEYCVQFAFANRKLMMANVQKVLESNFSQVNFDPMINIAHNYARLENHYGENVLVHRKGATSARLGEIGLIPGSQGTKSYIVQGRGNKESFESCSHGAGRVMGRKQAQRTLDLAKEQAALDKQGIIHSVRNAQDLDEAPSSYKDINVVMEEQKDLVNVLVELTPLGVIKG